MEALRNTHLPILRAALESANSYCRPSCEDESCDDTCGCPGHEEGVEHWPGQLEVTEDALGYLERQEIRTAEILRHELGLARDGTPSPSHLGCDEYLAPPESWCCRFKCANCGAHHPPVVTENEVGALDDFPEYPCPDDPDGQHHVGCGCEF